MRFAEAADVGAHAHMSRVPGRCPKRLFSSKIVLLILFKKNGAVPPRGKGEEVVT
jgi:hypothetical protein